MYSIVCVSLSYDTRNVFSLFSVKYMGSCPLNRNLYSGLEAIKASEEWGVPLSRCHIIAETTSPVTNKNKEQSTEADHSSL